MKLTTHTPKKPVKGDWPPHYILYCLHEKGTSYVRLSRLNGYCDTAAIMANHRPWPKMEAIIAEAIGVTPQEIWPSRYNEDGTAKHGQQARDLRRRNKNMARLRAADNVQVTKAT